MKRLLLDQGLAVTSAAILRASDWDVIHVREFGMHQAEDVDILAYAARKSRAVVTFDLDFPRLLALTAAELPSVVLIRQQGLGAEGVAMLLKSVCTAHDESLCAGCVIVTGPRATRIRMLPLK